MHILITGGTGFIGQHLVPYFLDQKYKITILTRQKKLREIPGVTYINTLQSEDGPFEVIINLAGAPIDQPWTVAGKVKIYESRIETTKLILSYIKQTSKKPTLLVSGSAVGFYGTDPEKNFSEDTPVAPGGFAQHVCHDWEATADQAIQEGVRVVPIRLGVVLGAGGGMLKKLYFPFMCALGAQLGSGVQCMPWIHVSDVIGVIQYVIDHDSILGPINVTAPEVVTNKEFVNTLACVLKRPRFLCMPSVAIKILFGEMGESLLLKGQKVIPERLTKLEYIYAHGKLRCALKNIFIET